MTGVCTPPDFSSAGGHWNPMQKQHGKNNPQGMHMGDLPNLLIGTDGRGSMEITVPGADLASGSNPMLDADGARSEEHTSELQSLMRISYAVFCLKKKKKKK